MMQRETNTASADWPFPVLSGHLRQVLAEPLPGPDPSVLYEHLHRVDRRPLALLESAARVFERGVPETKGAARLLQLMPAVTTRVCEE